MRITVSAAEPPHVLVAVDVRRLRQGIHQQLREARFHNARPSCVFTFSRKYSNSVDPINIVRKYATTYVCHLSPFANSLPCSSCGGFGGLRDKETMTLCLFHPARRSP